MRPILACLGLSALVSTACGLTFPHPAAQVSSPAPVTSPSAASAAASAPAAPPPPQPGLTFDAALARELPALPKVALDLPDVACRARVEAASAPTITRRDEGVVSADIPLGTGITPITCVWNPRGDVALTMMHLDAMPLAVDRTAVRYDHVAVAGDELVHSFAYVYRTHEESPRQGLHKLAFVSTHDGLLMCQHDEVGYVQTFRRIVAGMVKDGGSTEEQESVPFWDARYAVRLGEIPLGTLRIHLSEVPEAPRRGWARLVLLVPDDQATKLSALSVTTLTSSGKDGVVKEHSFLSVGSGKPLLSVTATRTAPRTYRVEGHVGDRPVNETRTLAANALFGKTPRKGPILAFQPTHEDPARFEERKERAIPGGTVFAGGVAIRKDERGLPRALDIPLGDGVTATATLEIERGDATALRW